MSNQVHALKLPLFERLAAVAPDPLLDGTGLRESIARDLERLFNVRNGMTPQAYLAADACLLHYGLPDLLALAPGARSDLDRVAEVVGRCIAHFEPRLTEVQVHASADPRRGQAVAVTMGARVVLGREFLPVRFEMLLDPQGCQGEGASGAVS